MFEIDSTGDTAVRERLASVPTRRVTPKMTPKQKKRRLLAQDRELSQLVFQTESEVAEHADEEDDESEREDTDSEEEADAAVHAEGDDGDDDDDRPDQMGIHQDASTMLQSQSSASAAWVDEDDETVTVDVTGDEKGKSRLRKLRTSRKQTSLKGAEYVARLRQQFESVQPDVSWAALPAARAKKRSQHTRFDDIDDVEDCDGDDVLQSTAPLLGKSSVLPADVLSVRRLTDLNAGQRHSSVAACVQWHPNGSMALTAGPDKTLHLFRTDGSENPKLQSIHLPNLPVQSAAFSGDGSQIFICGRSRQWATFDLHSGSVQSIPGLAGRTDKAFRAVLPCPTGGVVAMLAESGAILLVSSASKQLVATLQPGGGDTKFATQCACFSADGAHLYSAGEGGAVRVWDVRRRCCVHTWDDAGGLRCTALAVSPNSEYIAAGSDSGAVNLYRCADALQMRRPPSQKEYLNLTSAVTSLSFNPTSEVLAVASRYTRRAMRMVHVTGGQVFANWPTSKSPINYVQCTAFGPHSGYMAIGTDQGKALFYQLNHYAGQ